MCRRPRGKLVARSAPAAAGAVIAVVLIGGITSPAEGQFKDARLPRSGQLWLEIRPTLNNWDEQFAFNSGLDSVPDGAREPLAAHFGGSLVDRMYAPPVELLDDLNADAEALGFDPLELGELSFGNLRFSGLRAQERRLALGFELGILDRLSVGFGAPFVQTDLDAAYEFDLAGATVTANATGLDGGGAFMTSARDALNTLQTLINDGTLTETGLVDATTLWDETSRFLDALLRRSAEGGVLPTSGGVAGGQMLRHFSGLSQGFEELGLALPELALPDSASLADIEQFFFEAGYGPLPPKSARNDLALAEVEFSARIGVLDQITLGDPIEAGDLIEGRDPQGGIRFRTAVGALFRMPIRDVGATPLYDPENPYAIPIGDGQRDLELSLYQDIALGRRILLRSMARYGIQMADTLRLRISPPDRPYIDPTVGLLAVERRLGNYLNVVVRPSVLVTPGLSVGFEYSYFSLKAPSFELLDPGTDNTAFLSAEGSQVRHDIGMSLFFDLSEFPTLDDRGVGRRPVRNPWQMGLSLRRAHSGSGGRTPAPFRLGVEIRAPISTFSPFKLF